MMKIIKAFIVAFSTQYASGFQRSPSQSNAIGNRIKAAIPQGRALPFFQNYRTPSGTFLSKPLYSTSEHTDDDWSPIEHTNGATAIQKRILEEGDGVLAISGTMVEIKYVGTIADMGRKWSSQDVVECWLNFQQGLDVYAPIFLDEQIDGTKLFDVAGTFTDEFLSDTLGITNKIQGKKLQMAARRLCKNEMEFPVGTEFDSSEGKGDSDSYQFVLGAGKAIRAMDALVSTMTIGERAEMICRCDYAYGSEGTLSGTVPPFASLRFEVTLVGSNSV